MVYLIMLAATFSAGVFIILAGVRVVLAEIIPAFKGISERLKRSRFCSAVYARAFALALVLWWFASYSVGVR